jgi:hypothetical protein
MEEKNSASARKSNAVEIEEGGDSSHVESKIAPM